ncbi:MAG: hypothetical protein RI909_1766, partial [Bacteroidota bacterium]
MSENQKQSTNSDEIDLGVLFSKVGDFFKNIGQGIVRFLALMRRIPIENKALFISLLLLGIAGGISYTLLKKRYYTTTMILNSEYLNKRIVDNTIEKLNLLAEEDDKRGLAQVLQISDSLAENIYEFEVKPFVDESEIIELELLREQLKNAQGEDKQNDEVVEKVIQRIGIENRHAFEIAVSVYNPKVVRDLENALINYLKTNDFVKKRMEITKSNFLARKQKLLSESQKLDSLKAVIYANYQSMAAQSRQGSNNVILSDKAVTNPIEIFDQDINLYNEIQSIDRALYLQNDFEVVDSFTEFSEPSSAHPAEIIAIGVLI